MSFDVPREAKVTLGTLVIGDQEDLQLHGPVLIERSDDEFTVRFTCDYSVPPGDSDPEDTYEAQILAIEAALRTRDVRLLVEYGADLAGDPQVLCDFNPSGTLALGTIGLNVRSTCARLPELNTLRSARWDVTVTGQLPPAPAAKGGLRDWRVQIELDGSRVPVLTYSGTYASVGAGALDAYADGSTGAAALIAAYHTAQFSGDTFERMGERYTPLDDQDEVLVWEQRWREVIHNDAVGTLNSTSYANQTLHVARRKIETRDPLQEAEQLVTVVGTFSCDVDKDVVSAGMANLRTTFESVIRPMILAAMREVVAGQSLGVVASSPTLDPKTHKLQCVVEAISTPGGQLLERTITTSEREAGHELLRKLYNQGDEQALPVPDNANGFGRARTPIPKAFRFSAAGTVRRAIIDVRTVAGIVGSPQVGGGGPSQIPVGIGVGGKFNVDSPFENFLGVGVISEPGEVFFSINGGGGGGGGVGDPGPAAGGAPGVVASIVIDRGYDIVPEYRGIDGIGDAIPLTNLVSTMTVELYEVAAFQSGGDGTETGGGTRTRQSDQEGGGGSSAPDRPHTGP